MPMAGQRKKKRKKISVLSRIGRDLGKADIEKDFGKDNGFRLSAKVSGV